MPQNAAKISLFHTPTSEETIINYQKVPRLLHQTANSPSTQEV
jgi:hypothetical protein